MSFDPDDLSNMPGVDDDSDSSESNVETVFPDRNQSSASNVENIFPKQVLGRLQDRNKQNLLDIFKASEGMFGEIAKIKPEVARDIKESFKSIGQIFGVGGRTAALRETLSLPGRQLSAQFSASIGQAMVPIYNQLSRALDPITRQVAQTGGIGVFIGAGVGAIAGYVLGGNVALGALVGGTVGGIAEDILPEWTFGGRYPESAEEAFGSTPIEGPNTTLRQPLTQAAMVATLTPIAGAQRARKLVRLEQQLGFHW